MRLQHRRRIADEQRPPAQHVLHQRREVVDQRPLVHDLALDLLGRDRVERSEGLAALRCTDGEARHQHALRRGKDHVGAEVAMDDAGLLRLGEGLADLLRDRDRLRRRQRPLLRQGLGERAARKRRVGLPGAALELAAAEHLRDARVIDALQLTQLSQAVLEHERGREARRVVRGELHPRAAGIGGVVDRRAGPGPHRADDRESVDARPRR
ncbi:MAG: hypothetical protein U0168_32115 [Nannocystaceae bacterium]